VLTALVRNQKVYLYGEVATYHVRNRAAAVVGRVFGVAAVANHIKVVVDSTSKTDAQIKEEIEDQYFWNIFVDGGDIRVDVKDGVATLQGSVDSWHELKAAVEDAFQAGAEGVENELLVRDTSTQVYPQQYYPSLFWGM
jgi:osmotically-inducible protein OsmY